MPYLALDDARGVSLFYEDSGAPPTSDYTVLILIHGFGFNGAVFRRLFPEAASYNLRIVALYRRSYKPSSEFSQSELDNLQLACSLSTTDDGINRFKWFENLGSEFGTFILKFISANKINPAQNQVVVAGWSSGNFQVLAALAFLDSVPGVRDIIRMAILYDPPHTVTGLMPPAMPPQYVHPITNQALSYEERMEQFTRFVSGYFKHPRFLVPEAVSKPTIVSNEKISNLGYKDVDYLGLAFSPSPDIPRSTDNMTSEDLSPMHDLTSSADDISVRGNGVLGTVKHQLWSKAFTNSRGIKIRYLFGEMGTWSGVFTAGEMERLRDERQLPECDLQFVRMRGANHFVHWDKPEIFLSGIQACLKL